MLEFTISSPPVTGFKLAIPAAVQHCPLPPRAAGRGQILLFYFIASKEELLSLWYPLRGHFGTHQVGTSVFTHLRFDMNMSLVCGGTDVHFPKKKIGLGISRSSRASASAPPSPAMGTEESPPACALQPVGLRLQEKPLLLLPGWWLLKLSYLNCQFFCSTALTYSLPAGPHWWRIFLACLWPRTPSDLLCCSSSRYLVYKARNSWNNYIL